MCAQRTTEVHRISLTSKTSSVLQRKWKALKYVVLAAVWTQHSTVRAGSSLMVPRTPSTKLLDTQN